jgi:hypothetical protein
MLQKVFLRGAEIKIQANTENLRPGGGTPVFHLQPS